MRFNNKSRCCCQDVKQVIAHRHKKCNTYGKGGMMNGRKVNTFFDVNSLDEEKDYRVCYNILSMMKDFVAPRRPRKRKGKVVDINRCSKRLKGIDAIPSILMKTKFITVKYNNEFEKISMVKEEPVIEKKYCDRSAVLADQVTINKYSKRYKDLCPRERRRRQRTVVGDLISCCLGSIKLDESNIKGFILKNCDSNFEF